MIVRATVSSPAARITPDVAESSRFPDLAAAGAHIDAWYACYHLKEATVAAYALWRLMEQPGRRVPWTYAGTYAAALALVAHAIGGL